MEFKIDEDEVNTQNGQVMVSGATGFVGSALTESWRQEGRKVIGLSSRSISGSDSNRYLQLSADEPLSAAIRRQLQTSELFVHLAARTHSADLRDPSAVALYRKVNVDLTINLASACAAAGVSRFIFLSSVKACGERSYDKPMTDIDKAQPEDVYGRTKLEAESKLLEMGDVMKMDIVILRPPLIYGPGVKGNFLRLLDLARRGFPLPLGGISNRRSLIGIDNLTQIIKLCAAAPSGFSGRFFVSDQNDISTTELLTEIYALMDRQPRLFHVNRSIIDCVAKLARKQHYAERLFGNLQVDSSPISARLGWRPALSTSQGLRTTVQWFLSQ